MSKKNIDNYSFEDIKNSISNLVDDLDDNYFFDIGRSYFISDKLPKDDKQAFKNFKNLSDKDDPKAKYYLGCIYKL